MGTIAFLLLMLVYLAFATRPFVAFLKRIATSRLHRFLFALVLVIPFALASISSTSAGWPSFFTNFAKMLAFIAFPAGLTLIKPRTENKADWIDALAILAIWFPIEFDWLPPASAIITPDLDFPIHTLTMICLGFLLFLVLRPINEMGYNFRLGWKDVRAAGLAWLGFFLIGLPIGVVMGFIIPQFRGFDLKEWALGFIVIYLFNALPEELLFRGAIQNLIESRLGRKLASLMIAAFIFGLAHVDNTTAHHSVPNWPYVIMASIAGIAYGWTWRTSGKITASALTHTLVNFTWMIFFNG